MRKNFFLVFLLLNQVISFAQKDTSESNALSLGLENMIRFYNGQEFFSRLNVYYTTPLKNNKLLLGGYIGGNFFDQSSNYGVLSDHSIITNYPKIITKPDTLGNFIGLEQATQEGNQYGVKIGLENNSLYLNKFCFYSRVGLSLGYHKNTYTQDIAYYSNQLNQDTTYYETFKGNVINRKKTEEFLISFGLFSALGVKYRLGKKWDLGCSINADMSLLKSISIRDDVVNNIYDDTFKNYTSQRWWLNTNIGIEFLVHYSF